MNLVHEARHCTRAGQGCCLRAMLIAQPHDLSAKNRMLGLTCHLLFPNMDRAKTSAPQCDGGKLTLMLRSSMPRSSAQPRHRCCSKAEAAGRSPRFWEDKGNGSGHRKVIPIFSSIWLVSKDAFVILVVLKGSAHEGKKGSGNVPAQYCETHTQKHICAHMCL